jgi:acetyltransferase-like isoleucine patch superfamily enzyme
VVDLPDVTTGRDVVIHPFTNLYGCSLGDETRVGPFVEIQRGAVIGSRCKISSHSFICEGVVIEDDVCFTNDRRPKATTDDGRLQTGDDWMLEPTRVCRGASIGSGATILPGITIGERALVGAGSVVTRDVAPGETVVGNPARSL